MIQMKYIDTNNITKLVVRRNEISIENISGMNVFQKKHSAM